MTSGTLLKPKARAHAAQNGAVGLLGYRRERRHRLHFLDQARARAVTPTRMSREPFPVRIDDGAVSVEAGAHIIAPILGFSAFKLKLDIACSATSWTQGWRFHDLRRTARTLMSRAGVNPD